MGTPFPAIPTARTEHDNASTAGRRDTRQVLITALIIVVVVAIVGLIVWIGYVLLRPETPAESVERLRDIFIIIVALESLVIGVALTVLVVQLASLVNLLRNEVRPILQATSDTVNTLRGTTEFLGENVVHPVIEVRGYLAGITRVLELMRFRRK